MYDGAGDFRLGAMAFERQTAGGGPASVAIHDDGHMPRHLERVAPLRERLGAAGLATPVAARMMLVGERSGDMGQMFTQIARFHDGEIARYLDWFTRAFEPVLMAVLGVSIGLVVVLMYMPIFELAGNIK